MGKKYISKKGGWPWYPKLDGSSPSWKEWLESFGSKNPPGTGTVTGTFF
jgi:hypothetical protein